MPEHAPHLLILNAAEKGLHLIVARLEAGKDGSAAVPLCSQWWSAPSQGAELLIPALEQALRALHLTPNALSRIACVRGPGGFTGLRLTLVTAAGLARSVGAAQTGLDYLPLLAAQAAALLSGLMPGLVQGLAPDSQTNPLPAPASQCSALAASLPPPTETFDRRPQETPVFWVITHARRNLVHMQGFTVSTPSIYAPTPFGATSPSSISALAASGSPGVRALTDILVLPPEDAAKSITLRHMPQERPVLLGSGLSRHRAEWESFRPLLPENTVFLPEQFDTPKDAVLLAAALSASYASEDIPPLYVRQSDAEENLENLSASLGLDPHTARKRLDELTGKTTGADA